MFMGAGVDADPVAAEARESRFNRMAVDNHFACRRLLVRNGFRIQRKSSRSCRLSFTPGLIPA
jgi:hypothetical protein